MAGTSCSVINKVCTHKMYCYLLYVLVRYAISSRRTLISFFSGKQLFVSIRKEQEIFSSSKGSLCFDVHDKNHWLRSTKENAFIVRSDFENFGPFIDTDLAPPKNSSGAKLFRENDVIFIGHVLNLVLRLSLLCLLNEVAMCFVSTRSSVSICLASWCSSLFSLTFSSRLVYFLVEFWTLLPCLFYMFTITIAY